MFRLVFLLLVILPLTGRCVLTDVGAILDAISDPDASVHDCRLSGTVVGPILNGFALQTESGSIYIINRSGCDFAAGDRIDVSGTADLTKLEEPCLTVRTAKIVGRDLQPAPQDITISDILSGRHDFARVRLEGVITDAFRDDIDHQWLHFHLNDGTGRIVVSLRNTRTTLDSLMGLVDAHVSLSGIAIPEHHHGSRRFLRKRVEVAGLEAIAIRENPPANPFESPDRKSCQMAKSHRQTLAGEVLAAWDGRNFFMRPFNGRPVRVHTHGETGNLTAGTFVEAAGFVHTDNFYRHLIQAHVRPLPADRLPADANRPDPVAQTVFLNKSNGINTRLDGSLVRAQGPVRNNLMTGPDQHCSVIECNELMIPVVLHGRDAPPVGSLIAVTGICRIDVAPDEFGSDFNRVSGFTVITRSADDVVVIRNAPWWNTRLLLTVIGTLFLCLVGGAFWIRTLNRIIERRSRLLFRSQIERAESELRVDERTRLAAELHDNLSQNLTAITYQVSAARRARTRAPAETERHLTTASLMLDSCRTELRRCLWDLRSEALDEKDFSKAIRMSVTPVLGSADATIRFNVPRARIKDSTAQAILSIVRELVSNAVRHGQAGRIRIAGSIEDDRLLFSVRDDGCGFDPTSRPASDDGHFGLDGIRERLRKLSGTMAVESAPGRGTRVSVSLCIAMPNDNAPVLS